MSRSRLLDQQERGDERVGIRVRVRVKRVKVRARVSVRLSLLCTECTGNTL